MSRRARHKLSGQAMVEFAIVFPVQLLIVLGIVQLSLIYAASQVVDYAAFRAAREILIDPDATERARGVAFEICRPLDVSARSGEMDEKVSLQIVESSAGRPGDVVVLVSYDYELPIPVVGNVFASSNARFLWVGKRGEPPGVPPADTLARKDGRLPHILVTKRCVLSKPWR